MVIVFGAAGFVGSYLVDALAASGTDVLAVDIDKANLRYCRKLNVPSLKLDISRGKAFSALPASSVSCVVNLACLQPDNVSARAFDPVRYVQVNTIGTLNVLNYCVKIGIPRMLYTVSHRSIIASWQKGRVIAEGDLRVIEYESDFSMYSIAENAAMDSAQYYAKRYGIQAIIFRLPSVFGYGPHLEGYKHGSYNKTGFQIFIENAMEGKPIEVWGDRDVGRDVVYVKDVVSAIRLAIESPTGQGLYNIASGKLLTIEQEAKDIIDEFSPKGLPSPIVYRPEKTNSIEPCQYSIDKAKRELGWAPRYSFREMLSDYRSEMTSGRFDFLMAKRKAMMKGEPK